MPVYLLLLTAVSHRAREKLAAQFPVHVTVRLERGLPGLCNKRTYRVLKGAFAAGFRFGGWRGTRGRIWMREVPGSPAGRQNGVRRGGRPAVAWPR